MERAGVRFASRRGNKIPTRTHDCATCHERCTKTRRYQCSVGATARAQHACALDARAKTGTRMERAHVRFKSTRRPTTGLRMPCANARFANRCDN
eukprot:6610246-Lingulodinium_polyedra.AAC.1